ncbi:hypothetical protein [Lacticaseibacillus paracasei]|uniref:hypothetical protein n=2 Tax=Lactobacillaceae TaxID=33958 RepID=UPI001F50C0D0|nr:hypothetical protein [Lacticaseibacillus paracasei]MCI0374432.1 hypothetical protein [Lacticaseibacillus paracasei]
MTKNEIITPSPKTAAILITYQCVAQCDECCFACNPHLTGTTVSLAEIKQFLNVISKIKTIKVVVFSGGECFIEFDILKQAIKYANSLGFSTRCVSNGYWAPTLDIAEKKIGLLAQAGLNELNLSTGDSHQKFVPVRRVLYATIASLRAHLVTCISVETNKNKLFTVEDFKSHPLYKEYIKGTEFEKRLMVMPTVWVSFHTDNIYDFEYESIKKDDGCTGVFDTVGLEPRTGIIGCCGLTVNNIPEMHFGKLKDIDLPEVLAAQYTDFLKIWIFVDGPEKIVKTASKWANENPPKFAHKCLYCAYLYNNQHLKDIILSNISSVKDDVLDRYYKKCLVFNYAE